MKYMAVLIISILTFVAGQLTPYDKYWSEKYTEQNYDDVTTTIACPKCNSALHANYRVALTSNPIQYHAWCNQCGWKGYL